MAIIATNKNPNSDSFVTIIALPSSDIAKLTETSICRIETGPDFIVIIGYENSEIIKIGFELQGHNVLEVKHSIIEKTS